MVLLAYSCCLYVSAGFGCWFFSLPCASVSLQLLVQFSALLLQDMEMLGAHPGSWGGG